MKPRTFRLTLAASVSALFLLSAVVLLVRENAAGPRTVIGVHSGAPGGPESGLPPAGSSDSHDDTADRPAYRAGLSFRVVPGELSVYDARFETRTIVPPGDASREGETASLEVRGELECLAYLPIRRDTRLMGYRFSTVELRNERGPIDPRLAAEMVEDLGREVLVEMTDRGRIVTFFFPRTMRPAARNRMKAMLNATQIVFPAGTERRWKTLESDMTGQYRARYRAEFQSSKLVLIRKTKECYVSVSVHENGAVLARPGSAGVVPAGHMESLVDVESGAILSLRLKAQLEIREEGPWNGTKILSDARLERRSRREDPRLEKLTARELAHRLSRMESSPADAVEAPERSMEAARQRRLNELAARGSLTDVVGQLSGLVDGGGERSREAYELVRQLAALIALDEQNAWAADNLIRSGQLSGTSANFVAGALGSAGTEAAQEVLADLLADRSFAPGLRSSCLVALSAAEHPTEKAEMTLRALVDEIGDDASGVPANALLVLGVMADRVADEDGPRSADIARFLVAREEEMRTKRRIDILLEALGNAGGEESYGTIEKYLGSKNGGTRAVAVSALRRVEDTAVEGHLRAALGDSSPDVRLAAIDTLEARAGTQGFIDVVGEGALTAAETPVRRAAVVYLGERLDQPGAREILERVSANELDSDLRRLASEFLSDA
ncbi:MAG: HEAT repeat domain-containing protein [Planctomycetota bacterium]|nr:HEAT repeat domain-containing protein [Planctomycetota bacterium]